MIDLSSLDSTLKIIVAIIGSLLTFKKLVDSFATHKRKTELKTDLEILEKLKANDLLDKNIENKIKRNVKNAFKDISDNLIGFFFGLMLFIGFGWWTLNLFPKNTDFNPWIVATAIISTFGLSLVLNIDNNNEDYEDDEQDNENYLIIEINDKTSFITSICLITIFGSLTSILIFKYNILNFWILFPSLLFITGVIVLIQCVKRKK